MFTEDSVEKAIVEDKFVMLYPKDGSFINISNLYKRTKSHQNQINNLEILSSNDYCEFFSIELTQVVDYMSKYDTDKPGALETGTVISKKIINFDYEKFVYKE